MKGGVLHVLGGKGCGLMGKNKNTIRPIQTFTAKQNVLMDPNGQYEVFYEKT